MLELLPESLRRTPVAVGRDTRVFCTVHSPVERRVLAQSGPWDRMGDPSMAPCEIR